MTYEVTIDGKSHRLELERADGLWQCRLDGRQIRLDAVLTRRDVLWVRIDGKAYEAKRERTPTGMHRGVGAERFAVDLPDPRSVPTRKGRPSGGPGAEKRVG